MTTLSTLTTSTEISAVCIPVAQSPASRAARAARVRAILFTTDPIVASKIADRLNDDGHGEVFVRRFAPGDSLVNALRFRGGSHAEVDVILHVSNGTAEVER